MSQRPELTPEERALPYSKYYDLPITPIPDGVRVPEIVPKGLFAHNLKEFGHLAAILPAVYEEEKDNWIRS